MSPAPWRASLKDAAKGTVLLHNYYDFTNLADALTIDFEVTKNGETVQSGSVGNARPRAARRDGDHRSL